jgi:hypothetical protein
MNVIRHEAVRENLKAFLLRASQKLLEHEINGLAIDEATGALERAESQRIPIDAEIVESRQVSGMLGEHVFHQAKADPGPAEAGRHDYRR